jgi:hypothetical protein
MRELTGTAMLEYMTSQDLKESAQKRAEKRGGKARCEKSNLSTAPADAMLADRGGASEADRAPDDPSTIDIWRASGRRLASSLGTCLYAGLTAITDWRRP